MAGELKAKFLSGFVFQSLSWCSHTLKFLSETQVLFKASPPEASSLLAILELQGIALVDQPVSCERAQGLPESRAQPGPEAPGLR